MSSDHELMRRISDGDTAAFEALVARWDSRIVRVLQRLAPAGSDTEALAQDVFVRVFQASKRYQPDHEFSTWIYRIVLNRARDARRSKRHRMQSLEADNHRGNGHSPDVLAEQIERRRIVESSLCELPEQHREVLVLRHFAGLTFPRVAEVLQQPESTVKSRALIALKQLEAELHRRGLTNGDYES